MSDKNIMNIVVKGQDGEEVHFKVKKTTPFKKIMDAYCTKRGLARMYIQINLDASSSAQSSMVHHLVDGASL